MITRQAVGAPWAASGHELGPGQMLRPRRSSPVAPGSPWPANLTTVHATRDTQIGPATFGPATGDLARVGSLPVGGPRLELWRAPTGNDRIGQTSNGRTVSDIWMARELHRLQRRLVSAGPHPMPWSRSFTARRPIARSPCGAAISGRTTVTAWS